MWNFMCGFFLCQISVVFYFYKYKFHFHHASHFHQRTNGFLHPSFHNLTENHRVTHTNNVFLHRDHSIHYLFLNYFITTNRSAKFEFGCSNFHFTKLMVEILKLLHNFLIQIFSHYFSPDRIQKHNN